MNGTLSGENLSLAGVGDGDGTAGAASVAAGGGLGAADASGAGAAAAPAEAVSFAAGASSSLVRYRKPATKIATMQTVPTTSGHTQPGAAAVALTRGFLTCGVA